MIKAKDLVAFMKKAAAENWGYVYGAQGEIYTPELAEKWGKAKRSGKSFKYFVIDCARWFGKKVVDCSGLIIEALRSVIPGYPDKSSGTMRNQFTESGPIKTMPDIPGLAVWYSGHIGVYAGNGKVVEARGYKYGVVTTNLSSRPWKEWGKLRDVEYDEAIVPPIAARLLRRRTPMMRGDDVITLQELLHAAGYNPGRIDGIFGDQTDKAVRAFQTAKDLKVDGIVGEKTWAALQEKDILHLSRLLKNINPYMRGDDVAWVQLALIAAGHPLDVDGIFGGKTEAAVKAFQKAKGLTVDGIVGKQTIAALGGVWAG